MSSQRHLEFGFFSFVGMVTVAKLKLPSSSLKQSLTENSSGHELRCKLNQPMKFPDFNP